MSETPSRSASPSSRANRKPPRLGRGLSALVGSGSPVQIGAGNTDHNANISAADRSPSPTQSLGGLVMLPVDAIRANPFQPRRHFDERALETLADSIKADGVMQPIVVRRDEAGYELVAGERRLRATRLAGLSEIPAIVRDIDDRASAELALIENLQRADLNPVERAEAFRALIDRHGLTQAELGDRLGMDRTSISNHLRLLDLDADTLEMVSIGTLGFAHGRALAGVADPDTRRALAKRSADEGWSARRLEQEASSANARRAPADPITLGSGVDDDGPTRARAVLDDMEKRLGEHLGTRVALKTDASGQKGSLTISFFSLDEFDGLLERLGYQHS